MDRPMQPARLLCPWDPPGNNTGVDCHALLQGIFPTQGSNPYLLHLTCISRRVLYHWCQLGSPFKQYCLIVGGMVVEITYLVLALNHKIVSQAESSLMFLLLILSSI